ncbi:ubiquitin-conjugating enzyme E2 J1-like [Microplitis mediator]|uniref:ubiquitin-conjugating enzyme E2 J1-like n=1 Tax=Microplitis mediator TaxID=375433 RepID=UPI002555936C|nr:ubiquitin-conjugating enzyme E2 J1-like [Microplitis mediator]
MSFEGKYNTKSPAVKRLMREAQELHEATDEYHACPLEDNLFEWHFTVRGPPSTEFEDGIYHGRIILPPEYPMKPPNIILLTPNGRFEIHKKICLSISGHHPETWQPSWSIRTALLALIAFMPTPGNDTIGSLDYSAEERQKLAKKSQSWECGVCGKIINLLSKDDSSKCNKNNDKPMFNSVNTLKDEAIPSSSTATRTAIRESLRQRLIDPNRLGNSVHQTNSVVNQQFSNLSNDYFWTIIIVFLLSAISFLIFRRIFLV